MQEKRIVGLQPGGPGFKVTTRAFELSRWRGGRCACDTADTMGYTNVLNRLSPIFAKLLSVNLLQSKVDSNPIA
jgi:hypothetical protein